MKERFRNRDLTVAFGRASFVVDCLECAGIVGELRLSLTVCGALVSVASYVEGAPSEPRLDGFDGVSGMEGTPKVWPSPKMALSAEVAARVVLL